MVIRVQNVAVVAYCSFGILCAVGGFAIIIGYMAGFVR